MKAQAEVVNIVKLQTPADTLPEGATFYKETVLPRQRSGIDGFYSTPSQRLVQWVDLVARTEGPIEINLVVARLAKAWDIQRIGPKVRATIEAAIRIGRKQNLIEVRDGFVWPKGLTAAPVRVPAGNDGSRDIDQICTEEVAEAVYLCLKSAISLEAGDLVKQTAWLYGLRANEKTAPKVNAAIAWLIKAKRIEARDGKVRMPKE